MASVERVVYSHETAGALRARILDSETPLVITNVPLPRADVCDAQKLNGDYRDPVKRGLGWYNTALPESEKDPFNTSALVRSVLDDEATIVRPNPVRLWLQPGGHKTLMHYDGNSLSGMNLQVKGAKRWVLVSPSTPLPCATFNRVAAVSQSVDYAAGGRVVLECETGPGDMLYLPRYWFHQVEAMAPVNINVNWVWTPSLPDLTSAIGRREAELLKLMRSFPSLNRFSFGSAEDYGGDSESAHRYCADISIGRAMLRLVRELLTLPRTAWRSRQLLSSVERFKSNNFNAGKGQ